MATGDLVKLGTLYADGRHVKTPQNPWSSGYEAFYSYKGDVQTLSSYSKVEIKDSVETEEYKISWREVNTSSKTLLICDRNLSGCSLNDLKAFDILSKIITLNGKKYKLRILTYDEWVSIVCNTAGYPNLPIPTEVDFSRIAWSSGQGREHFDGNHNKFWNWYNMNSFIYDEPNFYLAYTCDGMTKNRRSITDDRLNVDGWRPVLELLNEAPTISDVDRNLGDKNESFIVSYQVRDVDNDTLIITEKLNGNVLRTLNNAPKGQDLIINISREQLYGLPLNVENKITIEVNDGKGGVSYRNYSFRRTNTAPIISNTDKNLGIITALTEKYTINDIEGNAVNVVEKLNNITLRSFAAILGKEYATTIDKDTWIKLKNGQHTYSIEATDSNNSKSTRVFSFIKKENKIDFTLAKPFSTDIKASKILVTPSWELNGATAKVEVCNNAFDVNPTWEDITKQVLINRHYNFTNTAKIADKWGVNIRIYIEKDPASLAEVSIKGFGGAFE